MESLGYVAIVFIGIVLGSMGAGGSMLAVPVLVYLFSLDMVTASAYSLFLVGMTSLAGAIIKQKEKRVDIRVALLFGIPSIIAAFIARKWIIVMIPEVIWKTSSFEIDKAQFLLCIFALLMVLASIISVCGKKPGGQLPHNMRSIKVIYAGFVVGLIAGLLGIGGGFLILPALMVFARLPFRMAVGTALVVIACNSFLGFCGDLLNHSVNWYFLLPLTGLAIVGMMLGDRLHQNLLIGSFWRKGFPWLTLVTGAGIFFAQLLKCW